MGEWYSIRSSVSLTLILLSAATTATLTITYLLDNRTINIFMSPDTKGIRKVSTSTIALSKALQSKAKTIFVTIS